MLDFWDGSTGNETDHLDSKMSNQWAGCPLFLWLFCVEFEKAAKRWRLTFAKSYCLLTLVKFRMHLHLI